VSATDAAQLARLKLTYPTWSIGRGVPNGPQFVAVRRATGRRVTASTVAGLEHKLATESPPASDGGVPRARLHSAHGRIRTGYAGGRGGQLGTFRPRKRDFSPVEG
jgi:hypothetical protein